MKRQFRSVSRGDWRLAQFLGSRRERLLNAPSPEVLLAAVLKETTDGARNGATRIRWQTSQDSEGYGRLHADLPLTELTFDLFFNGRSGYRAQFYLSPEEGVIYNRVLMDGLEEAITIAYSSTPLDVPLEYLLRSLAAPHSKVWVFDEQQAFGDAQQDAIRPDRWIHNGASRGMRAPLPKNPRLDIKGAFIEPETGSIFVDELKADRACDLFRKGYT